MYLIAGLGNPGLKYRKTPHNAGFMALDALADALGARFTKKGNGKVAEARIGGEKVLLVKPQTFMNLSGDCIAPLAAYYKIPSEHIAVCYDDKDLPMGKLRIRAEGSAGSHNGCLLYTSPALYSSRCKTEPFHFISPPEQSEFACTCRYRYRQPDQQVRVFVQEGGEVVIESREPQRAVTPGQYAVLYQGDVCLGGGVVSELD